VVKNVLLAMIAAAAIAGGIFYFAEKRSQFSSLDVGIPEYPGSAVETDSFSLSLPAAESAKPVKAMICRTNDPPAKVISFYKEKLAGKTQVLERNEDGNASAVFHTDIGGKSTIIMISADKDQKTTEIVIGTLASSRVK
jgi:hypothetical protein